MEPAYRSLEGHDQMSVRVEGIQRYVGVHIERTATVVALVHQGNQPADGVVVSGQSRQRPVTGGHLAGGVLGATGDAGCLRCATQGRHIAEKKRLKMVAKRHVVGTGAGRLTQLGEGGPERQFAALDHR